MSTERSLDQFYTNPKVAKRLIDQLDLSSYLNVVEPSAGAGYILDFLPEKSRIGVDLDPKRSDIIKTDFFDFEFPDERNAVVGNPPFGRRSSLAIKFFNKCSEHSDLIAFIVPVSWEKYEVQSKLNPEFKLTHSERLPRNSFLLEGKPYNVNCVWQVWSKNSCIDLRIKEVPAKSHPDFSMYLYNNTESAKKFFDYDWDFAVYRQGYKDYSHRIYKKDDIEENQHWMFFKASNKKVLKVLEKIDYSELVKQTTTPGFGKSDFIKYYEEKII